MTQNPITQINRASWFKTIPRKVKHIAVNRKLQYVIADTKITL